MTKPVTPPAPIATSAGNPTPMSAMTAEPAKAEEKPSSKNPNGPDRKYDDFEMRVYTGFRTVNEFTATDLHHIHFYRILADHGVPGFDIVVDGVEDGLRHSPALKRARELNGIEVQRAR